MSEADHEAAGSLVGYLFQVRWALLELIRRSTEEPDCAMTLELLDDVAWLEGDDPSELMQTKHHLAGAGGLGDKSVDLWRTIKAWIDAGAPDDPAGPSFTLVTTSVAPAGSAAEALTPRARDNELALDRLEAAAGESANEATATWRDSFLALSPPARVVLVGRMTVMDGAPHIQDLDAELRKLLHLALPLGNEAMFVDLVWEWWSRQALLLLRRVVPRVSGLQLSAAVDDLRDKFSDDNLPTLVSLAAFDASTLSDYDGYRFVHQLNFVGPPTQILRTAIQDYYRATVQSAAWIENNLVDLPEVARFKSELLDEWERSFAWATKDLTAASSDSEKRDVGLALLQKCLDATHISIRERYREPFFFRGKLHELADEGLAGWHPDFEVLLEGLLLDAAT